MKEFLSSLLKSKTYRGEMRLSPLFIETTVSILAGFFLFLWGFIFFSNSLYQFSLYTQLRNAFITEEKTEEYLDNIHCISIDAETRLVMEEAKGELTDYYYIAMALKQIKDFAQEHPEKRVVTGIDFAFLTSMKETAGGAEAVVEVLKTIPKNMFIVLGGVLHQREGSISTLHTDFLREGIVYPATDHDYSMEHNYFVGNIHVLEGEVRTGSEGDEGGLAAIGYFPIVTTGGKHFFSLPLVMFIAGDVMEKFETTEGEKYDFGTDFGEGISLLETASGIRERIEEAIGIPYPRLSRQRYYNFFTSRDMNDFPTHFIQLSDIADETRDPDEVTQFAGITGYYEKLAQLERLSALAAEADAAEETEGEKQDEKNDGTPKEDSKQLPGSTQALEPVFDDEDGPLYFFITFGNMPEFLLKEDEENDLILTPASGRNSFTGEMEDVSGVMAHITALSNLRHQFQVDDASPEALWLSRILSVLAVAVAVLGSWLAPDVKRALLYTTAAAAGLMVISFICFFFGLFVKVQLALALIILAFGGISIFRFIYTTSHQDLYEILAARILHPSHLQKIREHSDWKRPSIAEETIVLVLFPQKFPEIGEDPEEAERYTKIYNRYLELALKTFEKYQGNHILLSLDGIMGFWNVPVESDEAIGNSFNCAKEFLALLPEWQKYIDKLYADTGGPADPGGKENHSRRGYVASFDMCLNICRCYVGCIGAGENKTYALSGKELNTTILSVLTMREDEETTLFAADDYLEALEERGLTDRNRFAKKEGGEIVLYKYEEE